MYPLVTRRTALQRLALALGGALSASTVSAILAGCRSGGDGASAYAFEVLDGDQRETLATLVDLIIPETDTPGARAAGAHEFIDKLLAGWMTDEDRDRFLAGLADVDARAEREHGRRFAALDAAQQTALLTALDAEAYAEQGDTNAEATPSAEAEQEAAASRAQSGTAAMEEEVREEVGQMDEPGSGEAGGDPLARPPAEEPAGEAPPPFFHTLKELTLAGYYTSEVGATQELQWNPAPGRYDADVPVSEVGRAWA